MGVRVPDHARLTKRSSLNTGLSSKYANCGIEFSILRRDVDAGPVVDSCRVNLKRAHDTNKPSAIIGRRTHDLVSLVQ